MKNLKVSIILPVYNNFQVFLKTFESLLNQKAIDYSFEIIISDDCSSDGLKEYFENNDHLKMCTKFEFDESMIKYLRNDNNLGRAITRNKALENSVGEIIIFLDSDNIPDEKFIVEHVKLHSNDDKTVGVGNVKFSKDQFNSQFVKFWDGRFPGRKGFHDYSELPFYYPGTSNGSVKKKTLKKLVFLMKDFYTMAVKMKNYGTDCA